MAGRGTISVNQTPQYGDKKKLDAVKKGLTKTPMTGVPTPAPTAGRPAKGGPQPQQESTDTTAKGVPGEHSTLMKQYATAFRTNQYWQGVLQKYPSEWSKMYAQEAKEVLTTLQQQLRSSTPFFE